MYIILLVFRYYVKSILKKKYQELKLFLKTCSKGFEQKVATLRLKTPLKMKENFIGNRAIAKETKINAELSQAEMLGKV